MPHRTLPELLTMTDDELWEPETCTRCGLVFEEGIRVRTWCDGSYYGKRFQWWGPHRVVQPWCPRVFRGGDEFCNDSIGIVVPFLGCVVIFYNRRLNTDPNIKCEQCEDE